MILISLFYGDEKPIDGGRFTRKQVYWQNWQSSLFISISKAAIELSP